jgi:ketosteroid isomerase-like protein
MRCAALAVIPFMFLSRAHAQDWSAEQQEVWSTVESYWDLFAKEDLEGFLSYLHDDFRGWTYGVPLPRDKSYMQKSMPLGFAVSETIMVDIKPVAIQVHGNLAIVHYYYERTYVDAEGSQAGDTGRWTDVLVQQDDRWMMIADHGGSSAGG